MENVGKSQKPKQTRTTSVREQDLTPEQKRRVLEYRRQKAQRLQELEIEEAERKQKEEKAKKKEKKLIIAGFVISLVALLIVLLTFITKWAWLPFVGIGLGIIDAILLVPLIVKCAKRKKLPAKSGLFIVGSILMTIGLVLNIILGIIQITQANSQQNGNQKLDEVDVNGMTISDACGVVRSKNWSVLEVTDENSSSNKSDCSDMKHKVSSYRYYNKDSSSNAGKVILYYIGEAQDSGSSSGASSKPVETEQIDQNFRNQMDEYEQFVDQYVGVIRAHKADPTNEALIEQYNSMTTQYNERVAKINQIDTSKLSSADREYYNTVVTRANKKIAEASQS